jgi:hypothetical protein
MSLPFRVKDKSIQGNFDHLSHRLGSYKVGDIRTVATYSMPVGAAGMPVDKSGLTIVLGIIIVEIYPSGHFNYTYHPRPLIPDIVFNNTGAVQNIRVSYIAVGQ